MLSKLLDIIAPEYVLVSCMKNKLQLPMGDSLDDARWLHQLDWKIKRLSMVDITEFIGIRSKDTIKSIKEFILTQKKEEEEGSLERETGMQY